jgi:hypothetical protein
LAYPMLSLFSQQCKNDVTGLYENSYTFIWVCKKTSAYLRENFNFFEIKKTSNGAMTMNKKSFDSSPNSQIKSLE